MFRVFHLKFQGASDLPGEVTIHVHQKDLFQEAPMGMELPWYANHVPSGYLI